MPVGVIDQAGLTMGAVPAVRRIGSADVWAALRAGWADFMAIPTQLVFLCVLYPIVGLVSARAATDDNLLPLIFPLLAGLSLLGPVLAVGVYELSRRRELGLPVSWTNAFDVLRSPNITRIVAFGMGLLVVFAAWLAAARLVFLATIGGATPMTIPAFWHAIVGTSGGAAMILVGNLVGFCFAAIVLSCAAFAVPMLLDRPVPIETAVATSIRAVRTNPGPMALWGLIVAATLVVSAVPVFLGLAVAMPVLGHATWHLYRRVVA